jgi:hypothetical protein
MSPDIGKLGDRNGIPAPSLAQKSGISTVDFRGNAQWKKFSREGTSSSS